MSTILQQIVEYKREFLENAKRKVPLADLKSRMLDMPCPPLFAPAIHRGDEETVNVIAEVKKKSPSKGVIREDFDPIRIAIDYAEHGAAAISVLTDEEFFAGSLDYLRQIRAEFEDDHMPLLRKDFTIDEYQVYEARDAGAAAILLITSILDKYQLVDYRELANELGMDALTEVHLEAEADRAAELGARIIGINNRDLRTFSVDLKQTQKIMRLLGAPLPGYMFVAESGIQTYEHVQQLSSFGVDAILVGETLMREPKPGTALQKLMGRDEKSMEQRAIDEEHRRRFGDTGVQRGGKQE
ncbi:MAG: indole-3-glycerol phosphate synthase TrpC [Candidatus Sumerlaeaceae bacterium]